MRRSELQVYCIGYYEDGTDRPRSPVLYDPAGIVAHTDGGDRGEPNDTLNFQLPAEWTQQDKLILEAKLYPVGDGLSSAVHTKRIEMTFRERNQPPIYSWRFRFPEGQVASEEDASAAANFMAKVYPVNSDRIDVRDQGVFTTTATTWEGLTLALKHDCNNLRANIHNS